MVLWNYRHAKKRRKAVVEGLEEYSISWAFVGPSWDLHGTFMGPVGHPFVVLILITWNLLFTLCCDCDCD